MKKLVLRWVLLVILLCLAVSPALANSWGLKGDLLSVVMEDGRWDDYSTLCNQQGDFAVMGSRYHNVLMQYKDGGLLTYPLAVWQETDKLDVLSPKLEWNAADQLLTLSYGSGEVYVFALDYELDQYDIADALVYAEKDGLGFNRDGYGFTVSDGETVVYWQRNVLLKDFNIKLFPRSIQEVQHLNRMYALLNSGIQEMDDGASSVNIGTGTVPVYSAPFGESAWRAGKGKAAVGLSGQHWRMGEYINDQGEAYTRIRYEVSERTQRIGYVRTADLNSIPIQANLFDTIHVPLEAQSDTWLTDDPRVSQYQQFYVPPGMPFICMGTYGMDYAWVAAKAKNNSFVDGGQIVKDGDQIVWGYVPLRDLTISSEDFLRTTIEWDVMARFAGHWVFAAGGVAVEDHLMLYADGTWEGYTDELTGGTWQITRYDPADGLYWADVPYEVTFFRDYGSVRTLGFQPHEDGSSFSLLYWEGSGGYERLNEPFDPADAGGNG